MKVVATSKINFWYRSIINSYAQIFFSLNQLLGVVILLVTFISPFLGICGLSAIVLMNIFASSLQFNRTLIYEGIFGFNALLLGLALGHQFKFSFVFAIVFVCSIALLLMFTILFSHSMGKHGLPFLSLPFIFTFWLVSLASVNFSYLGLQDQHIYVENYKAVSSQSSIYVFAHSLDGLSLPILIKSYLKTLSSTFFQNSVLAGILIAGGLIYFSRIAFTLSLIGFVSAYYTFKLIGADTVLLTDSLVGSNYIFLAIAIGGFYTIPSAYSYLSVIILTPILVILYISLQKILSTFQLNGFTLSFSILSILYLFFLRQRLVHRFIQLVSIQYYSAEKTIYKHLSTTKRFAHAHLAKLQLPVWGQWKISQGYNGSITHLGDWSSALDFVITGEDGKTYNGSGTQREDFYCYNKPVVATLDGYVHSIFNQVDENEISEVNIKDNWGNTIVLNHNNGLYSQLSHLKKDSYKVKVGDFVKKGTVLATCGNSGRSPEPHIHFQLQLSPKIGEKTFPYPIAYFMEGKNGSTQLKTFEVPKENSIVSNVEIAELLHRSFDFAPGQTLRMRIDSDENISSEWKIYTDAFNRTYLHDAATNSTAWFANDGVMFYCYDFEGDKKSLLFQFYLASYRIFLGAYSQVKIEDVFPLIHFNNRLLLTAQDFVAPFFLFTKANYQSQILECDNANAPKRISIQSSATTKLFGIIIQQRKFEMHFAENQLKRFIIQDSNYQAHYSCEIA